MAYKYILNPSSKGDVYTSKGKFRLDASLTQDDLKHLYEDAGLIQNVLRIEIEEVKAKKKSPPNTGE